VLNMPYFHKKNVIMMLILINRNQSNKHGQLHQW